jgi:hypothetical protein
MWKWIQSSGFAIWGTRLCLLAVLIDLYVQRINQHEVRPFTWLFLGYVLALVFQRIFCKMTGKLPTQLRDIEKN